MGLSAEAKAELAEAIAIVREDRMEKFLRSNFKPTEPKAEPPKEGEPPTEGEPPKKEGEEPPKPRKGGYWGELLADD